MQVCGCFRVIFFFLKCFGNASSLPFKPMLQATKLLTSEIRRKTSLARSILIRRTIKCGTFYIFLFFFHKHQIITHKKNPPLTARFPPPLPNFSLHFFSSLPPRFEPRSYVFPAASRGSVCRDSRCCAAPFHLLFAAPSSAVKQLGVRGKGRGRRRHFARFLRPSGHYGASWGS